MATDIDITILAEQHLPPLGKTSFALIPGACSLSLDTTRKEDIQHYLRSCANIYTFMGLKTSYQIQEDLVKVLRDYRRRYQNPLEVDLSQPIWKIVKDIQAVHGGLLSADLLEKIRREVGTEPFLFSQDTYDDAFKRYIAHYDSTASKRPLRSGGMLPYVPKGVWRYITDLELHRLQYRYSFFPKDSLIFHGRLEEILRMKIPYQEGTNYYDLWKSLHASYPRGLNNYTYNRGLVWLYYSIIQGDATLEITKYLLITLSGLDPLQYYREILPVALEDGGLETLRYIFYKVNIAHYKGFSPLSLIVRASRDNNRAFMDLLDSFKLLKESRVNFHKILKETPLSPEIYAFIQEKSLGKVEQLSTLRCLLRSPLSRLDSFEYLLTTFPQSEISLRGLLIDSITEKYPVESIRRYWTSLGDFKYQNAENLILPAFGGNYETLKFLLEEFKERVDLKDYLPYARSLLGNPHRRAILDLLSS